jgi:hypothetical protein
MNNEPSTELGGSKGESQEGGAASSTLPLLKILEDMLHHRITKETGDTQNNPEHSAHRKIMDADTTYIAMGTVSES